MPETNAPIPRPLWCPHCAADYAGDDATCAACNYDAAGELVLFGRQLTWRQKARRLAKLTAGIGASGGVFCLTILGMRGHNSAFLVVPAVIIAFACVIAALTFVVLSCRCWFGMPVSRRWSSQVRFTMHGWSSRMTPGTPRWKPWLSAPTCVRLPGGRSVTTLSTDKRSDTFPLFNLLGLQLPPGGLFQAARMGRELFEEAAGVEVRHRLDVISQCPQCFYHLGVPDHLPRPGRCPECGWVFDETTLVSYGDSGITFSARRPRGQSLGSYYSGLIRVCLLAALPAAITVGVYFAAAYGRRYLPIPRGGLLGTITLVGAIWLTRWIVAQMQKHMAHERGGPDAPPQSALLVLTPDGFAQRKMNARYLDEDGQLRLHSWSDYRWRLICHGTTLRLVAEPQRVGWFKRRRLKRSLRAKTAEFLSATRRLDFYFAGDRAVARELRQRLRRWPQAREIWRGHNDNRRAVASAAIES